MNSIDCKVSQHIKWWDIQIYDSLLSRLHCEDFPCVYRTSLHQLRVCFTVFFFLACNKSNYISLPQKIPKHQHALRWKANTSSTELIFKENSTKQITIKVIFKTYNEKKISEQKNLGNWIASIWNGLYFLAVSYLGATTGRREAQGARAKGEISYSDD